MVCDVYFSFSETLLNHCVHIHSFFKKIKAIVFIRNLFLFKYLQVLTELIYLSLNKLTSKYGKLNCPNFLYTLYKA